MLRAIGAVVLGYLTMAITVFATFTAAYFAMGVAGAYKEGVYDVSTLWIVTSSTLALIAAVLGGLVCGAIARGPKPVLVLAALVVVLGGLSAVSVMTQQGPESPERPDDVPVFEAMTHSRQPLVSAVLNPLIGAAGVIVGAAAPEAGVVAGRIRRFESSGDVCCVIGATGMRSRPVRA